MIIMEASQCLAVIDIALGNKLVNLLIGEESHIAKYFIRLFFVAAKRQVSCQAHRHFLCHEAVAYICFTELLPRLGNNTSLFL